MTSTAVFAGLSLICISLVGLLLLSIFLLYNGNPARRSSGKFFPSIGNRGEALVRSEVTRTFNTPSHHLLNNVTLPFGDGTTQIDHILISTKGVFVMETKDYSGWIFADAKSPTWTQVIYRVKSKFPNPLRQNYRHVKAIQKLLDFIPKEHIHSIVVFTGTSEFKTPLPENVFKLQQLADHIHTFQKDILTENQMQFIVGRIECTRYQISRQTDVEHQAYLKRKYGET